MLGFIIAAAIVYVLTPLMGRLARRTGVVDTPTDDRRMHDLATPLLGGLGMYIGWLFAVVLLVRVDRPVWGIIGGATIVVVVGLFDDLYELEPIVKFFGQLLAISVAIYFDIRVTRIGVPFTDIMLYLPGAVSILFTAVWMAMIVNMVNFIDGLDGLAAGVCGISAITFSIIALSTGFPAMGIIAAVLAGATFAFLRFNFHPATIFMGDAGSTFIGYYLAVVAVLTTFTTGEPGGFQIYPIVMPLLVFGLPIYDTASVMLLRIMRGVSPLTPDRNHFSHRLRALGLTARETLFAVALVTFAIGCGATVLPELGTAGALVLVLQGAAVLGVVATLETAAVRGARNR